jgi:Transcription factor homologous to NACalpha-BTF3
MEITLEKIELVKDRTGVTYAEAKKALEDADGSVVDAIIAIEETVNSGDKKRAFGERGEALFASLKSLIKKGNVARILVKKESDTVLNVPVNAGILGICIAPLASVVAIVAAFGFKCTIEVVKTDGTIIDVSDAVSDKVSQAAEFGSDKFEELKVKGKDIYDKAKDSDIYDKAKDAASDLKDKAGDFYDKTKDSDIAGKAKDAAQELRDKVEDFRDEFKERVSKEAEEAAEAAEDAAEEAEEFAKEVAEEIKDED